MRIGIDGRSLQGDLTGIGRYVYELCRKLDSLLPDTYFFVYSKEPVNMPVKSERWISRVDPLPFSKYIKMWQQIRCGTLCKKDELDIFWGCATFLPRLPANMRTISTVHDLNFKIVPETLPFSALLMSKFFFKRSLDKADIILTNSRGTSDRLYDLWRLKPNAIVPPSVTESFSPQPKHKIEPILKSLGIQSPFILSVATWEPRKNLKLLINTFISMKNENLISDYKLVLIGRKGWKSRDLISQVNKDNRNNIIPIGYVPDEHLPSLYSGADIFVFPSIYEGFGIPVLEARACNTKVITSDTSELKEAGGPNSLYIEPTSTNIRNAILSALSQPDSKVNGINYHTWEDSARILADVIQSII